ncbi:MAG TPA: YsnF/AvaK domain-containing protein [Clostridia bacterium]
MFRKSEYSEDRLNISKYITSGALVGGTLGAVAGFLYNTNALIIPGIGQSFRGSPVNVIMAGTVPGILLGAGIGILMAFYTTRGEEPKNDSDFNNSRLQLREEQLDISKKRLNIAEVNIHKEVIREDKNISVPVYREELVVEKKILDEDAADRTNEHTETIRIPLSEEKIDVVKHSVVKNDVDIYKRQLQETKHIEEVLKKEKINVEAKGEVDIVNEDR